MSTPPVRPGPPQTKADLDALVQETAEDLGFNLPPEMKAFVTAVMGDVFEQQHAMMRDLGSQQGHKSEEQLQKEYERKTEQIFKGARKDVRGVIKELGTCKNPSCTQGAKKVCSACKIVFYCSPACQKAHWKRHKPACKRTVEIRAQRKTEVMARVEEKVEPKAK